MPDTLNQYLSALTPQQVDDALRKISQTDIPSLVEEISQANGRLDNLIVSGTPTQGNAELLDLRVGVNNQTYPSAGAAVRAQVKGTLKSYGQLFYSDESVPAGLEDLNNLSVNTIYGYTGISDGFLQHAPHTKWEGILFTAGYSPDSSPMVQFAVGYGELEANRIYTRMYFGGVWTDWNPLGEQIYYVGHDLTPDATHFTSLTACFRRLRLVPGKKTVHIGAGSYDMVAELGGTGYFSGFTGDEAFDQVQPVLNDVHLIGHGDVVLEFHLPDSIPEAVRWLFSPLNLRGNFCIENLEINASNCRYCIHDESGSQYPGTVHRYRNIRCYKPTGQVVACGYSNDSTLEMRDCRLVCGSAGEVYSYHAKQGMRSIFSNCLFLSSGAHHCVRFSQENDWAGAVQMHNCFLNAPILLRPEFQYAVHTTCQTRLDLINTNASVVTDNTDFVYDAVQAQSTYYDTRSATSNIKLPSSQ